MEIQIAERQLVPYGPIVDSRTLDYYLFGAIPFSTKGVTFAQQLNLAPHAHFFKELYASTTQVYILDEGEREKLAQQLAGPLDRTDLSDPLNQAIREPFRELMNLQGDAERARVIYIDEDTWEVRATEIAHGEYRKSWTDYQEIWDNNHIPLLEVHTHPNNVLPSPIDYYNILVNVFETPDRFLRGIVVLCPDVQILALATPRTRILPPGYLDFVIEHAMDLPRHEQERLTQLNRRYQEVQMIALRRVERNTNVFLEFAEELLAGFTKGLVTREEIDQLVLKRKDAVDIAQRDYIDRYTVILNRAGDQKEGYNRFIINAKLLAFARRMNIKLYTSFDFTHFREFSA